MGESRLSAGGAGVGRVVNRLLDELVERARVDAADIVAEARQRGIAVSGDDAGAQLASLRRHRPEVLDPLATSFVSANLRTAGIQGFIANVGGAITLPVAVSADTVGMLALLVRTTSGVMGSYGFESETTEGRTDLRLGLLVAAGVNRLTVRGTTALGTELARRLGFRMTRQRVAKAVPLVGGAIGAGINMAMIRTLGRRSQRHYRDLLIEWQSNAELAPPAAAQGLDVRSPPPEA